MSRRMPRKWSSTIGLIVLLVAACLAVIRQFGDQTNQHTVALASENAVGANDSATERSESKADNPPRIKAANVVALRQNVGKQVTVFGAVERTATSRNSGMQFLNMANSELAIVSTKDQADRFEAGPPATQFKNQFIEITGELKLYKGKLQMQLTDPSQIRIVQKQDATAATADFALKAIGRDKWMSPAGLIYQGRDPQGLTRKEHIMRHAADQPTRDGPHGVFAGNSEESTVFSLIDEAWILAKKRGTRPNVEGERSTLLVSLGRPIGYLGGRTGAKQGKPALKRIFIVYETGTTNIVTAFPR